MTTLPAFSSGYAVKPQTRPQSKPQVHFSGSATAKCVVGLAGLGTALGTSPLWGGAWGIHKAVEAVQFRKFKNAVSQGTIAQHFPETPAGDKALHERMRWLVGSGNVELVKQALAQDRVKALDLNVGDHIGEGKKSALYKAITRIENPETQTEMVKALMTHPQFDPNAKYENMGVYQAGTLLERALEMGNADLVRTILQDERLEVSTVKRAKNSPGSLLGHVDQLRRGAETTSPVGQVTPLLNEWLEMHDAPAQSPALVNRSRAGIRPHRHLHNA